MPSFNWSHALILVAAFLVGAFVVNMAPQVNLIGRVVGGASGGSGS